MKSSQRNEQGANGGMALTLPCWSPSHSHETQGSLLTHLTPVAHAPGSTGPQVTMSGWLGAARRNAVLIPARAAAHQPPGGAQTTSGGTLWVTDAFCKARSPSPCQPYLRWPHIFICKNRSSAHLPRRLGKKKSMSPAVNYPCSQEPWRPTYLPWGFSLTRELRAAK